MTRGLNNGIKSNKIKSNIDTEWRGKWGTEGKLI